MEGVATTGQWLLTSSADVWKRKNRDGRGEKGGGIIKRGAALSVEVQDRGEREGDGERGGKSFLHNLTECQQSDPMLCGGNSFVMQLFWPKPEAQ